MHRYLGLARQALRNSTNKEKVFAVTENKGRRVGVGINCYTRSHRMQRDCAERAGLPAKVYLHAEIAAIIKSRSAIDTIYVYRLNRKGDMLPSKPCPVCQIAIEQLKLKVYHV